MAQATHLLGKDGKSSEKIAAAKADLEKFPTSNIYDGGCATCACEIPIILQYENGDPVPDAEFVVKWGEQKDGKDGEVIVVPQTAAQKKAPEIKGVVDKNGLARVKNSPCGTYIILFGEGSDAMKAQSIDKTSELHKAIDEATKNMGVDKLTPKARGQLLWWMIYWMKEKNLENMRQRIKNGEVTDKKEILKYVKDNGAPLWTDADGKEIPGKKETILKEVKSQSPRDLASWGLINNGVLYNLECKLESKQSDFGYPDDKKAERVARYLEVILTKNGGTKVPNERFYQVLQNITQAEQVAGQLVDPNAKNGGWDVFLLIAEAVLGCIPVIGDVIDVVDIIKWLHKFSGDKEAGTWDYIELGALSLGFIPVAGVLLKKCFAPIARFFAAMSKGARKVPGGAGALLQKTIQILRKIGDGNLVQWLIRQKTAVKNAVVKLKKIIGDICESVVAALGKYLKHAWPGPVKWLAEKLFKIFKDFKDSINKYIDPFLNKVDDMVARFIARIANRFTGSAGKNIDPTVFKLRRRKADGSGGLGGKGNGEKLPEGTCPIGMKRAMGSNPVNMILGQPFINQTDFSAGLFSLERTWTPEQGGGLFGPHWSTPLSSYVHIGPEGARFQTAMGRKIPFDVPFNGAVCANIHDSQYELIEYGKGFAIRDSSNLLWIYEIHDGSVRRLSGVRDDNGVGFDLSYALDIDAPMGLQPQRLTLTNGDSYDFEVSNGRMQRIIHSATGTVEAHFEYNKRGLLVGATNAAGYRMGYGYDAQYRLTDLSYHNEHKTRYTYDAKNRVTGVISDTRYYHDRFEYGEPNADGTRAVSFIDTLGHRMTTHIDSDDQVIRVIESQGAITGYEYNDNGDVVTETSPLGTAVNYEWDSLGNLLKTSYADGSSETFERDERGRLLSFTDPAGAQWRYERDAKGNVIAEHGPDEQCWRYQLNQQGQPIRIDNPDGSHQSLAYNPQHRLARVTDPLGAITEFSYNAHGQLATRIETDNTQTHFYYDAGGRLTSAILANGSTLRWQWSVRGDLLQVTDGEGKTTQRHYGPYGLLEAITDPGGGTVRFEHDRLMRLTGVINANNECYQYDYDAGGRVTTETDFSGRQLRYRHDIAGRLIEKTAGNGIRTAYTYDIMSQLSRTEVFEQGEQAPPAITRFKYDTCGRIIAAQNRDATVELERDILGRVISETLNGRVIESEYGAQGELASRITDGHVTDYSYNANGLMSALRIGEHAPLEFEHDLMGRERQRRSGAGFAEHRQWDRVGQLKTQIAGRGDSLVNPALIGQRALNLAGNLPTTTSGGVAAARAYDYDRASNPTTITDTRWGASHYNYNANDQITQVDHEHNRPGLMGERFSYDQARNMTQSEQLERGTSMSLLKEPPTQASHNDYRRAPGGRIQRRGDTTYAYDAQGRLISKRIERKGFRPQKWQYQWDGEDQLRRVTTPDDAVWDYHYDPFGRRIGKACVQPGNKRHRQAQKVSYLWAGNLLSEERRIYADGREQTVAYHYEQDSFRPIAQEVDGELSYIVTDHLGTPKELLSEEGELRWSASYKLWGKIAQVQAGSRAGSSQAANDADGKFTCLLRFQGQLEDEESGLYYNRFRYYDAESGGYVSADPIGLAGGLTLHGYVDNPGGWVDPFGLNKKSRCGLKKKLRKKLNNIEEKAEIPGNSGLTSKVSARESNKMGKAFVGPDYITSRGRNGEIHYTSADGSRLYRGPA
ncbi:MAG TPA: RHS repeat protein, partial [Gammaproteobacteria bacterium]|nr:RHS repeat protein [Gammaproteobacteria bacterium]